MKNLLVTSLLCISVVCVSPEIKQAAKIQAKYTTKYVEYSNKKIEDNPDEMAEEMVGVGKRLDRNAQLLDGFFNGKED